MKLLKTILATSLLFFSSLSLASNQEMFDLRDDLQQRGLNVEVREIRYKYFDPHCFGTYGYFKIDGGGYDAVKMFPTFVVKYINGTPHFMDIIEFSRFLDPNTTVFVQVTK